MLHILILSEHTLFRQALGGLLRDIGSANGGIAVAEADVGPEACGRLQTAPPDVVLLRVTRPTKNSIRMLNLLRESADVPVLVLVDVDDEEMEGVMIAAMQAGAAGCVDETANDRELAQALEDAANGQIAISAACARRLARTFAHNGNGKSTKHSYPDALTAREIDVLALLAEGLTNMEIARTLFISESTVRAHLRTVTQKLRAHNRVHAVARALHMGMLPPLETLRTGARNGDSLAVNSMNPPAFVGATGYGA